MDYLKKHGVITQAEYSKAKEFIIFQLKLEDDKGHTADNAISNVRTLFYDNFISNSIIEKHVNNFGSSLNDLENHKYNYNPNKVDPILKTLENQVYKNFIDTLNTFKNYNIDQENFEGLTFEMFYPEILKLVVYKRCHSRLNNSIPHLTEAFKLFYETNNYDEFTEPLLQDESDKVTVERIQKIFIKYSRKLQIEDRKKSNDFDNKDLNRYLIKYKEQISKFDDNEKALLLHLCVRPESKLNTTEKVKIILIAGGINNDYLIFEEAANINSLYNKINKGLKNNMSKDRKEALISSTLEKIKLFKLPQASEILESMIKKT